MAGLCIHPVYLFVCLLDVFLMKLVSLLQTVNWFLQKVEKLKCLAPQWSSPTSEDI